MSGSLSIQMLVIGIGGALVFASWRCVKFVPLLRGQYQTSDHCTGSLIAILGALFALILLRLGGGGGFKIPIPIPGGGGKPPPTEPPPEEPPVEPPPIEPVLP